MTCSRRSVNFRRRIGEPLFGAMAKPERLDLVRQIQEPHDLEIVQSDADDALLAVGRA